VVKGKAYGKEIDEAMKELEDALTQFKEEAHICGEQRLGNVEHNVLSIKRTMSRLEGSLEEAFRACESQRIHEPDGAEIRRDQATVGVLNRMYKLLTSSEIFDARTGGGRPNTRRV
jgi:hypothetical protein